MRQWARRRLDGEEGISLVEILVAVFLLTVGLFALLGSFIASAHSLQEQERRSLATRVGTETLESLRNTTFDEVPVGTTNTTVERSGVEFDVETDIEWRDALDWDDGSSEDLKYASVTVAWDLRGESRSVTFSTAITALTKKTEEDDDDDEPSIVTVSASPDPMTVDGDGIATEDVQLRATLDGFEVPPMVTATWTNHATGLTETVVLDTTDEVEWRADVSGASFSMPDDDDEVPITFEVVAEGLTRTYPLQLVEDDPDGPEITSVQISQDPVQVNEPHENQGCAHPTQNCRNSSAITFQATVTGLDEDNFDSVKVRYLRRDGSQGELALIQNEIDSSVWRRTLDANSERFKPGTAMGFTFIASSVTDGTSTSYTVERTVVET
jgi:hypothetical protein